MATSKHNAHLYDSDDYNTPPSKSNETQSEVEEESDALSDQYSDDDDDDDSDYHDDDTTLQKKSSAKPIRGVYGYSTPPSKRRRVIHSDNENEYEEEAPLHGIKPEPDHAPTVQSHSRIYFHGGYEIDDAQLRERHAAPDLRKYFARYSDEDDNEYTKRIRRYSDRAPLEHFVCNASNDKEITKRLHTYQQNAPRDHFPPLPDWYLIQRPPARNPYPWRPLPPGLKLADKDPTGPPHSVKVPLGPFKYGNCKSVRQATAEITNPGKNEASNIKESQTKVHKAAVVDTTQYINIRLKPLQEYTPQLPESVAFPDDPSQLQLGRREKFTTGFEECLQQVTTLSNSQNIEAIGHEFAEHYQKELLHFYYLAAQVPQIPPKIAQLQSTIIPSIVRNRQELQTRVKLLEEMLADAKTRLTAVAKHQSDATACLETLQSSYLDQTRETNVLRKTLTNAMQDVIIREGIPLSADQVLRILPSTVPTVTLISPSTDEVKPNFLVGEKVYYCVSTGAVKDSRRLSATEELWHGPVPIHSIAHANLYRILLADGEMITVSGKKLSRTVKPNGMSDTTARFVN